MKVVLNKAKIKTVDLGDVKILVKVLTWAEKKPIMKAFFAAGGMPGSETDPVAALDFQDAVVGAAVCGWEGIVDEDGNAVEFDKELVLRLEPYEEIAPLIVKAAGFEITDETVRNVEREAAEAKN